MTAAPVLDQLPVLADGLRARLLGLLADRELTVSELCDILQVPQSTVSRHLKTLADAGWIGSRRDGTSRLYGFDVEGLDAAMRRLWDIVHDQVAATPAARQDAHRLDGVLARRRSASQEFFSTAAGQWDRLRAELFGGASHLRALPALLDESAVVGDLGCGTGEVADAIAPFVERVFAIDASREMLQAARHRLGNHANVEVRRGALERLPLDPASLDIALVFLVLHHVADPAIVLAEAARVLRPGGRLLVVDMLPHEHDEYRQTMGHVWLGFPERQVARYLAGAGFERFRWRALPADPSARGPSLFAATARLGTTHGEEEPGRGTGQTSRARATRDGSADR